MSLFIVFLIVLVCVLLVIVILAQNSKGGGLTAGMGNASQIMGTRRTTDITEKATWILASALFVLCLTMNVITSDTQSNNTDSTEQPASTTTPTPDGTGAPDNTTNTQPGDTTGN
ncbi:MAG: preprotein translocase subunit SecG [Flammeovirgaceae bacterium]